jgi:hypothetical protein
MNTPYFSYVENFVDREFFHKVFNEVDKLCIRSASKGRRSCVLPLHEINLVNFVYSFGSGSDEKEKEDIPFIQEIREKIELYIGKIFDYVLVHIYESGEGSINYHTDREAMNTTIASISLGATRKFRFKEIGKKTGYDYQLLLKSGDLVLMHPGNENNNFTGCQQKYLHCVPVEKKVKDMRINLTFRQYDI